MRKNLKVVQINGFRGLIMTLFIISCLSAGFIAFPSFLTMSGWNYLANYTGSFPTINFVGGVLLWAIIAFSFYIFNKRKFVVSFNSQQELTEDEIKNIVSKIKTQTTRNQDIQTKDLYMKSEAENQKHHEEEKQEVSADSKES